MFLPAMNTFVVFSIDPVATLDCSEDEEMTEICKGLTNKNYVAYIDKSDPYVFNPSVRYHSYELYLLSQGLPSPDQLAEHQEPDMVIPILPNTSNPTSRIPIQPGSKPLPWDDCYLSVFCAVEARCAAVCIPRERRDYKIPTMEAVSLQKMMSRDYGRRKQIYLAQHPSQTSVPVLHAPPQSPGGVSVGSDAAESRLTDSDREESDEEESDEDGWEDEEDSSAEDSDSDSDSSSSGESGDAYGELIEAILGSPNQSYLTPVFIASNDLDSVDKVNDPKEFFEEVELLKKLREDFKAIKLRKIEETRRLDQAHFKLQASATTTPCLPQETSSPHPDIHRDPIDVKTSSSSISRLPQETLASPQSPHTHADKDTVNVQMLSPTSSQLQGPERIFPPLTRIKTRRDVDAPKGLNMGRLRRKAGDAIQNMAPRKLSTTFSAIRRNGIQRLSWALHRLRSDHKAESSNLGSIA